MNLRDRMGKAWRWPLYSRARAVTTVAVLTLLVLLWPRLTGGSGTSASAADPASTAAPGTSEDQTTPTTSPSGSTKDPAAGSTAEEALTAGAVTDPATHPRSPAAVKGRPSAPPQATPTSPASERRLQGQPATLKTAPRNPLLISQPTDYTSATKVAERYLQVWCWKPADKPANTNIANVAAWVTATGWADDKSRAVTTGSWKRTQAAGLTSRCGPISASEPEEAPQSDSVRWITMAARQVMTNKAGKIVGQQTITQTRRVLLAPDGRWLVDVEVTAG